MEHDFIEHSAGRRTPAQGVVLSEDMPLMLFCTVCTDKREAWVTQTDVREVLHEIWQQEAKAWLVGPYVLMPDHLHFLCIPQDLEKGIEVERWTAFWKDRLSKRIANPLWRWQRGLFHHRLRNDFQLQEKLEYMQQNPVKKGFVTKAEAWPWRGEVHDLNDVMKAFGKIQRQ
jgi:putative transposase